MRFTRLAAVAAAGVALALGLTACGPAIVRVQEPVQQHEQAVELGAAQALDVQLQIGVGVLNVKGTGGTEAMHATFDYRPASWRPDVRYTVEGTAGQLVVEQPNADHAPLMGDVRNTWDVQLNDKVPLVLRVDTGVGKNTLELGRLDLRRLDVDGGVGETTIDLGTVARNDVTIDIDGGVGRIVVKVPAAAGVRVTGIRDGVGSFSAEGFRNDGDNEVVNDAWGKPGVKTYDVRVTRGVGDVTIEQQ